MSRYFTKARREEMKKLPPPVPTEEETLLAELDARPPRGPGHPSNDNPALNPRIEKYICELWMLDGMAQREIARKLSLSLDTIQRVLSKYNLRKQVEVGRARVAGVLSRCADNLEKRIEQEADPELPPEYSYRLMRDSGASKLEPDRNQASQLTGIAINLSFLTPERAQIVLGAQPTDGSDSGCIDVDAEAHEDKGRAGREEPVQTLPKETVFSRPARSVDE